MKDELISAETFEIAKQKGFVKKGHFFNEDIIIPTQSLLQRWLREVHNIQVYASSATINMLGKYRDYIFTVNGKSSDHRDGYDTYEEALEKGLQEGLKLIK